MTPGSPQDVARREQRMWASPIWHERQARQAREGASVCDAVGLPDAANELLRMASHHESLAASLRAEGRAP